ncbi:MAG: AarF/UbiB family protein, partial [Desulfobacteraceae bacterium]
MFPFSDHLLAPSASKISPKTVRQKLNALAATMGDEAFRGCVAREIVARTRPHRAVPEIYGHYRPLVRDGIEFFLSRISRRRLVDLVVNQLKMDPAAGAEERLLEMAKRFPTLHKLGQIIARHPNIDPTVRKWLVRLENGRYGTSRKGLLAQIHDRLESTCEQDRMHVGSQILAEASVGAVIPFKWTPWGSQNRIQGVFKILKPHISRHLNEELTILEETAAFFEAHRARYPFKDLRFVEILQDVREMLVREIDLTAEQAHLDAAHRFYQDMDGVCIPQRLPLGTAAMTAMAYLEGPKITDAALNPDQRRRCAALLFDALICKPLFAGDGPALFHGDPHAGNILAVFDPETGAVRIGLLDWSLAGRLARSHRVEIVQLIQAILREDWGAVSRRLQAMAGDAGRNIPVSQDRLHRLVVDSMQSLRFECPSLIKKAFRLLEEFSYEGFVFPPELMLFRKAIFTLEGVLHDLWPAFDMDAAVIRYLSVLVIQEIPMRIGGLFFPMVDRPENYPSLISNSELQYLLAYPFAAALKSSAATFAAAFMPWI